MGLLHDRQGNDAYHGVQTSQGYGGCAGVGLLFDRTGMDVYNATNSSQGWGLSVPCLASDGQGTPPIGGFGFFFDSQGDDYLANSESPATTGCFYLPDEANADELVWMQPDSTGFGAGLDVGVGPSNRCAPAQP